jgi:putrescine aminotransferase
MTPDKSARSKFASDVGTVGMICRTHCFENGLVMRHVGDRMIISPPIVINKAEIDQMFELAVKSLDQTLADIKDQGLYK